MTARPTDWLVAIGGMVLFLLIQARLFQTTVPVPGRAFSGWFLNAESGIRVVGFAFATAGLLAGLGPGSIFPIVIVFGIAMVGGATALGAGLGLAVRRAIVGWVLRGDR